LERGLKIRSQVMAIKKLMIQIYRIVADWILSNPGIKLKW
ncbi:unnamed protein product, partial [marine sediment metagenome]